MKDNLDKAILLHLMCQQALDAGVRFYDDYGRQLTKTKDIFKTFNEIGHVKSYGLPPLIPMVGVAK